MTSDAGHEFARAQPSSPRCCDVCDTFFEDVGYYFAFEISRMTLVPGADGELEPLPRISYELRKHCSIECGNEPVNQYLDGLGVRAIDPPDEPVTPCAVCGTLGVCRT